MVAATKRISAGDLDVSVNVASRDEVGELAGSFNHSYAEVFKLPEPMILEDVAVVPGTDGRKMSKSYDNTIRMFAREAEIKKAVMGIVTDSTPVDQPKDTATALFQLWSLFATGDERKTLFERATAPGLGYGEVKKDLLARLLAQPHAADAVAQACFTETSTLGLRVRDERRRVLPRTEVATTVGGTAVFGGVADHPGLLRL